MRIETSETGYCRAFSISWIWADNYRMLEITFWKWMAVFIFRDHL